jgi:hypothetical protein
MASDKLVFDLSSEIEGSTNVFIKKDWINILDNMNQNYSSNQSVIDTSQLSNSNKYMSYREAYLLVPMVLTVSNQAVNGGFLPATAASSADYCIGLKSWFGNIIHSFTLDYNGVTVIQQTPYINMVNCFKLLTSLSWDDVITQGATIGFYPDTSTSFSVNGTAVSAIGQGTCFNMINPILTQAQLDIGDNFNSYSSIGGNVGALKRCQYINYDPDGTVGLATGGGAAAYSSLQTSTACSALWKSFISTKVNAAAGVVGVFQISITATIYLKHIHSFFAMCPLLKGVFMKMTMNLNNASVAFTTAGTTTAKTIALNSVSNPVGGVCPFLLSSQAYTSAAGAATEVSSLIAGDYYASVAVGNRVLAQPQAGLLTGVLGRGPASVYLYVPAYTFNPVFESAYLSSPIKRIAYDDVYQYQVLNIGAGIPFNNLLTNGIANLKSILIIPFFSASAGSATTGLPTGIPVFQSPFDTAGCGTTSPLIQFNNFNVVVSGQNAIYNTQQRMYEQFNDQFAGCNAVNGGLTDGLTSSLIGALDFDLSYCYYYVNVERMLPVEQSVPKSVQIIGINQSARAIDLYCFLTYQSVVSIDTLTGSRV